MRIRSSGDGCRARVLRRDLKQCRVRLGSENDDVFPFLSLLGSSPIDRRALLRPRGSLTSTRLDP